jgi:hypothetical protein
MIVALLILCMQNKGTGELSFLTCFVNVAGSIGNLKYMPNMLTLLFELAVLLYSYCHSRN